MSIPIAKERRSGVDRVMVELHEAGYPSVADDLSDLFKEMSSRESCEVVYERCKSLGPDLEEAASIIAYWGMC